MKKSAFFTFFAVTLLLSEVSAQSFYAVRRERTFIAIAGTGTSSYFGDLRNPGDYLDAKLNLDIGLQFYVAKRIFTRAELTYFTLKGDDAKANDDDRVLRNLSFTSGNFELSVTGAINLLPNGHRFYQRPIINVYPFAGVGIAYINPRAEIGGQKYALQPLRTEGVKYSRVQPVIPYGLGIRFKVGPFFNVAVESGWRLTFTDYLDDVSTVYPDPASFSNPIAASLSMRYADPVANEITAGTKRGNPTKNDSYYLLNAKIEYYLPHNFFGGGNKKLYSKKRKSIYKKRR
jgi:hypothetical protein